ncbi:hypothetical protein [Prescottella agglutinans]|uniref:Uncharacterized protein n=1 Tax=Prescottella agglutinans TaxID=1644129 RepID=A0ABT6MLW0_9NOCA|nr:hypothetical protein [Prescottella agglutinans]MDH6284916.1 hypothetical protein [Prescottella agglutinans]
MGFLDDIYRQHLLDSGLDLMNPGVYRGTVDSVRCAGRRHNVFVSVEDDAAPSVMTPIGLAENLTEEDVRRARDESDGCELRVIASYAALMRPLQLNPSTGDPDVSVIINAAIDLGLYGDLVEDRISTNRERR